MTGSELRAKAAPFLLWLAFKGVVTPDDIAARWSGEPGVDELVEQLLSAGMIGEDDGTIYLDDSGDELLHDACHGALTDSERQAVSEFVERFGPIDMGLKQVVTRWQGAQHRTGPLDKEALALVDDWMGFHSQLHEAVSSSEPVVGKILESHLGDLDDALDRFVDGDTEAFSGGADDSYHSRWFVMHELILRSIGTRR